MTGRCRMILQSHWEEKIAYMICVVEIWITGRAKLIEFLFPQA